MYRATDLVTVLLVVIVSCYGQFQVPDDEAVEDATGKKYFLKDTAAGILLQGAHYLPVVSRKMEFPVYAKRGGYTQALREFTALPFTGYLKEWGDGSMAGYVGNKAVVLMRGPYSKHAWISIRSKVNTKDVQAQVWYMVAERNADDEEEGEATEKSD